MAVDREGAFRDQVCVITGAASGIGWAVATELTRRGATVVLADVDEGGLTAAVAAGSGAWARVVDVREVDALRALAADVVDRHGRIDLWWSNAGIVLGGESHLVPVEEWRRVVDVNLIGVINGVAAAYPVLVAQGHGRIVNTASLAGLAPAPFVTAYSASKHAVVGLSRALRAEAAAHGVGVTVVCPGAVDTPILDVPPSAAIRASGPSLTGRAFMAVAGMPLMDATEFAGRALDGVARNKAVVVVGGASRAMWMADRLAPGVVDRMNQLMATRVRRAMAAADG